MKDETGVIYILTNPSFPNYVKIGYADNLKKRLIELNRSECIPFAFRPYAVYETSGRLQDKEVHEILDSLNPSLRAIDEFNGKPRIREFFAMSPEDVYRLLKNIAKLSGTLDKLKRIEPEEHAIHDENLAKEIENETKERRGPFSFEKCQIPIGSELTFTENEEIKAVVLPNNQIKCNGNLGSLSSIARELLGVSYDVQGPLYWKYNGKIVNDIRLELEEKGLYK